MRLAHTSAALGIALALGCQSPASKPSPSQGTAQAVPEAQRPSDTPPKPPTEAAETAPTERPAPAAAAVPSKTGPTPPATDKLTSEQAAAMAEQHAFMMAQQNGQPTPPPAAMPHHGPNGEAPIDCPLRKAGVNPHGLKPFAEVEKYIEFLERPDRAEWQKPDAVTTALQLKPDDVVADIGAGSGYFSFRFAKAVPQGRVVAMDVEAEMVRHVHHHMMTRGLSNLEAQLIKPDAPEIPKDTSVVFICDVLHHVQDQAAWLRTITDRMSPGTRLVLIEFAEGDLPQGPPAAMKIPKDTLISHAKSAGLVLSRDQSELLPYQVMLEFKKT